MLTKIWTGFWLVLLAASLVAFLLAVAHEKNIHPLRDFAMFFKKQTKAGRIIFGSFFIAMWIFASVKPGDGGGNGGGEGGGGDGGTNNIQMVIGPGSVNGANVGMLPISIFNSNVYSAVSQAGQLRIGNTGTGNTSTLAAFEITSTNTTRTLTSDDFERGFVMTRIGTGEQFDFSPPSNAVVCTDWQGFGGTSDWIYLSFADWVFRLGENDVRRFKIHQHGSAVAAVTNALGAISADNWFSPLKAAIGIAKDSNWILLPEESRPSQFWHAVTPDNRLLVTWQNVLLDRATDKPLSFQVELFTDGRFNFRYDLSRLNVDAVTNILIGASFGGNEWTTNALPTNVTSMAFYPLSEADAYDQDPDNDGLLTIDELFFYDTDPRNADTDYDGLNDGEELLVYGSDPLAPNSISATYCDGFAAKLGDLDPFSCPEGSTNTIYEHIFYTGTTNGVIVYPQSSIDTAVLEISVSGTGTGRLIVGDSVVPLVAPPQMRSGAVTNTLLMAVGKGVRKTVWWKKPDGLDVTLRSSNLMIGCLPTWYWPHGWIAFPHVDATEPCIHDFCSKGRVVTLVHGEEFPGLAAEWESEAQGVVITNEPPVSAEVYGSFPKSEERYVSYTISHPDYICGATNYAQTLRFCPRHVDEPENGSGGVSDDDGPEYWSCDCASGGNCNCCTGEWCHCSSWGCPCNANQSPTLDDDQNAEAAYTNIVNGAQQALADVLYLYRDNVRTEFLPVPGGPPKECCPCPEHRASNYVAKVAYSGRVAVKDAAGNDFDISHEPCSVTLSGVSPSREFSDSTVVFVTNGVSYKRTDYTVLGVKFESNYNRPPLSEYNQRSPSFGYPITVCTNMSEAATIVLRTDVRLTNGVIRLSMLNVTGGFQVWLPEWWDNNDNYHAPEMLLSSAGRTERHFGIRQWRGIMRRYDPYGAPRTLAVKVLSSSQGRCDVKFEYAASNGSGRVHDHAQQRITSVNPVLLVDYDRDGAVGATDIARHMAGRYAYFWRNDDKWKGDNAFDLPFVNRVNSSDDVVNGRNDLINFLPVSVDVAPFAAHWSSGSVYYRLEAHSSALRNAKLAFADIARTQIGDAPLGENMDVDGNALHEAPVSALGGGTNLPPAFVSLSQSGSGTIIMEFPDFARDHELYLNVYTKTDNALLFSAKLKLHVGDVSNMLGWKNLRRAAGGSGGVPTRPATDDWPEDEHEEGNLVFVHGYNMEEDVETQLWAQNVFKKLWWSGLDRGFIAVQWRGNEGQMAGTLTPNYYGNVQNAFQTAPALSNAMATVQGPKWFVAHSLGNMLVSAAIQDYGMPYEKYFMLNAAIALEAFDPIGGITTESHDNMTPRSWTNYVDRVRATHWFERFPEGDGRRLLTWKGRFANVTNIVNFYSTQEEVVNNGDGDWHTILDRNYVWYNQETRKGLWPMMIHEYEGGWEFNPIYDIEPGRHMAPTNAAELTNTRLQQTPFFLDFYNPEMHTSPNGMIVASNYLYRAEMLAYAIPSESFAVGANPIPGLTEMYTNSIPGKLYYNHDMASLFTSGQDDLPENDATDTKKKHRDWQHSTFVQRSYKRVHQLYKEIVKHIEEAQHEQ